MAKPHEKLAESLAVLKALQDGRRRIFNSDELTRVHRERLLHNGFLRDVIKGWLMSTGPQAQQQDTTPCYASFWEFCFLYCNDRFGKDWFLSPEQSLLLHAEAPTIPPQVVVNSPKGTNNKIDLLFGTSLYDLKVKEMPAELDREKRPARVHCRGRPYPGAGSVLPARANRDAGRHGVLARRINRAGPAA